MFRIDAVCDADPGQGLHVLSSMVAKMKPKQKPGDLKPLLVRIFFTFFVCIRLGELGLLHLVKAVAAQATVLAVAFEGVRTQCLDQSSDAAQKSSDMLHADSLKFSPGSHLPASNP